MNRLALVVVAGCSYSPSPGTVPGDGSPNDSTVTTDAPTDTPPVTPDWMFKRTLTIGNQGIAALEGFPLHVSLNSSRIDYAAAKADGADLRFEDAQGTPLPYEIERWNPAGTSTVWVRVPAIADNANTDIVMYYGNPDAADAQNAPGVWDADYLGVWHLADAHDSTATSTSTNNGGTPIEGKLGPAMDFAGNGSDDHVDTGLMTFTSRFTVEAWINPGGAATVGTAASPVSGHPNYMLLYSCGSATFCETVLFNHDNNQLTSFAEFSVAAQDWSYVVGRYDGATIRAFVNGGQVDSNPTSATPDPPTLTTKIGSRHDLAGDFDGGIDEVRISKISRSTAYIAAQFKSMADTYVTYGPQQLNQ